jgi:hypothetical protein
MTNFNSKNGHSKVHLVSLYLIEFLCIVELVVVLNIAEIPLAGCQSINQYNLRWNLTLLTRLVWAAIVYIHLCCRKSHILAWLSSLPVATWYLKIEHTCIPVNIKYIYKYKVQVPNILNKWLQYKNEGPGGSMSWVVGLPNNSYKPITNTAWVRTWLCKLQKRVHSTRIRKW